MRILDPILGPLMLDEVTLDVIDRVRTDRLKTAERSTVNRYLGLIRSIVIRARDEREWIDKARKIKLFK